MSSTLGRFAGAIKRIPQWPIVLFGLTVSLGLIAILASELLRTHVELTQGQLATSSIKAPRKVEFQSNIQTEALRREAAEAIEPVFRFDNSIVETSKTELSKALDELDSLRGTASVIATLDRIRIGGLDLVDLLLATNSDLSTLATLAAQIPGIGVSRDEAAELLLLSEDKWQQVRRESLRITNQAMRDQISEAQVETAHHEAMRYASNDLNEQQIALVRSLSRGSVRANYLIDETATEQTRLTARQTVEPVIVTIEAGETILHDGEIIRPGHLEVLQAVGLNDAPVDMRALRARAGLLVGLVAILVGYLASYRPRRFQEAGPFVLLGLILLVTVGLSKLLPIENDLKPVAFPFAAGTMLVSLLLGARLAVVVGVVSAFAISVIEGNNFQIAPQLFIAGTVGALAVRRIDRTNHVFIAGLAVGLSAIATGMLFRSWGGELEGVAALTILAAASINGILSAVIVVYAAPILGEMFEITAVPQPAVTPDDRTDATTPDAEKPDLEQVDPAPPQATVASAPVPATTIAREQATSVSRTSRGSGPVARSETRKRDTGQASPAPAEASAAGSRRQATTIAHERASLESPSVPGEGSATISHAKKPDPGEAITLPPPATVADTQSNAANIAREQATMVSRTSPGKRSNSDSISTTRLGLIRLLRARVLAAGRIATADARRREHGQATPASPEEARSTLPTAVDIDPEFEDVSPEFAIALLTIVVGTLAAHADGAVSKIERDRLKMRIDGFTELSAYERGRLHANLKWMIAAPPNLDLVRTRCHRLNPDQKRLVGRSAIAVASTDGKINPSEVRAVQGLYRAIGLSDGVFLHDLKQMSTGPATAPAAVSVPRQHDPNRSVHEPPRSTRPTGSVVVLDPKRLDETKRDTQQVSIILGEVFATDDTEPRMDQEDSGSSKYEGLDRSCEAMVDEILTRPTWSRRDFDELAMRFDLMADGALEEVNEWTYRQFDEALLEEEMGRIEVNPKIVEKLKID